MSNCLGLLLILVGLSYVSKVCRDPALQPQLRSVLERKLSSELHLSGRVSQKQKYLDSSEHWRSVVPFLNVKHVQCVYVTVQKAHFVGL